MGKSKFTGMFDETQAQPDNSVRNEGAPAGRPPGKKSDPRYKQHSWLVKRENAKIAGRIWEDQYGDRDMSNLVDKLLEKFISQPDIISS
jgi:hypothetical protein